MCYEKCITICSIEQIVLNKVMTSIYCFVVYTKSMKKTKRSTFAESDFYFDNCELCRMMKDAEEKGKVLTLPELKQGFLKMREKAAVVGGDVGFDD